MIDLDGHVWRVITRSKADHIAHLIPSPLVNGARTVCDEAVDPYHATHTGLMKCVKCARIAREQQEAE